MNKYLLLSPFLGLLLLPQGWVNAASIVSDWRPRLESRAGNSVDTATGAFLQEVNLIRLQGARDLDLTLTYRSDLGGMRGDVGYGWTHQYEARLPNVSPSLRYDTVYAYLDAGRWTWFESLDYEIYQPEGLDFHDRLVRESEFPRRWQLLRLNGVRYDFDGDGYLTGVFDRKRNALDVEYYDIVAGESSKRIFRVREPITGRSIFFVYRRGTEIKSVPLLYYLAYGEGQSHLRFLKYDERDQLSRIYDPVQMQMVEQNTNAKSVTLGPGGVSYPITVARSDSQRLIRVFGDIVGSAPKTLKVELLSPAGKRVPLAYERTVAEHDTMFPINFILDDFLNESLAGTWVLQVTDDTDDGFNHTIRSLTIYAADDPANWTQYDYKGYPSRRIIRATDGREKQIYENTYDSSGRVAFQEDGRADTQFRRFTYANLEGGGLQTRVFSRIPNVGFTTYQHDANFNLLSVEDILGHSTTFGYNPGTIDRSSITDALGNRTYFSYEALGNLVSVTEANFAQTFFQYTNGLLASVTDALGFKSTFEYDEFKRLTKITNPKGITQERRYSEEGQLTLMLNKNGNGIEYGYTSGMPTSAFVVTEPDAVDHLEYDSLGRLIKLTDPDGNVSTIVYDNRGNIVEKSNALGQKIRSTYDHRNRLMTDEDPRGNVTTYTYDANDNLNSIINPLGEVTSFAYDPEDRLVYVTDAEGNRVSEYQYDLKGRLIRETTRGDNIYYEYDAVGNRTKVLRDTITLSETVYDTVGQPIRVKDSRGNETTFTYDLLGQQISRTEPAWGQPDGATTVFHYDAMNRVDLVTDTLGREFKKVFDVDDVLKELWDADAKKTTFSYTDRNQVKEIATPQGYVTQLEYTRSGFLRRFIPPSLIKAQEYTYDSAGRLVVTRHTGATEPDQIYGYDPSGNRIRTSTQSPNGGAPELKILRSYDELNRQISVRNAEGETTQFAYSPSGRVSQITYPDGKTVQYAYDTAGRLETVMDWAGRETKYSWNGDQITGIRFPNGTVRVMAYSPEGLLLSRTDFDAAGAVIVSYEYSYDANGFITSEQTAGKALVSYTPTPATFDYDDDNRLIKKDGISIGYDDDGNVVTGPVGGQSHPMVWSQRNNLERVGASDFFYYDVEDRLVGLSDEDQTLQFTLVDASGGSRILVSRHSTGPVTRYVYGVGLAYEETDGRINVHHYDERGNTTALSNDTGQISGTIAYSPFGEIIGSSGDTDTLFKYGGLFGVVTAPNGLYYMRFRWYSPEMKRFVSMDSTPGDILLSSSLNRYIFAGNNPVNFNDPSGQWLNIVVGAVGGGILGATVELVSSHLQGKPVNWNDVAAAAIGGAIAGTVAAAGCPTCSALGGGLGSVSEDLSRAALNGTDVDLGQMGLGAVTGAAAGGVGGKIGKYLKSQWRQQIALDAKISGNFGKPLNRLTQSKLSRLTKAEAIKDAVKFPPRLVGDFLEDAVQTEDGDGNAPGGGQEGSQPPGNVGVIIGGSTRMPASNVGKGGEYLHYQRYLDALITADRPWPDPVEQLATF